MAKIKTTATSESVNDFILSVKDETKRKDSFLIVELMQQITGEEPKMWGPTIIGFGKYHYKYASGHQGDMPVAAFSPRSTAIVFYLAEEFENKDELFKNLGKYKTGKVCVYVKKLEDIDIAVLKQMIINSIENTKSLYPTNAD